MLSGRVAKGDDFVIQSFDTTGQLTFRGLSNANQYATKYRVEWASSPQGPWTNFAAASVGLDAILPPVDGTSSVAVLVPMCYRVVASVSYITSPLTVDTPTITPDSGTYTDLVFIALSCTTADATIRYTTNGVDPTSDSPVYSGTFTLTSSATIKAQAFLSGYNDSAIASASFAVLPPVFVGTVQFNSLAYTMNDDDRSVTLTVTRTGGSFGSASVNYTTADGSAFSGLDYIATNGMVTWGDGDDTDKTITVVAINDSTHENDKKFSVYLGSVNGATLGSPSTATVTILASNYLVVDLSAGSTASNYPLTTLSAIPTGGWSDEYKTSKMVFRRISAGAFIMGSPSNELSRYSNENQHQVTLTQPFYMGVFEVTQKQWERVMGTWPSYFNNASYRDTRPVEQVSYNDIRGMNAGTNWPANGNVDVDSFMGRLRARTDKAFDLPTESQWEYAGRAGTVTALNSGYNITNTASDTHVSAVGRYLYNGGSNHGQSVDASGGTAKAGSYLPNAWGLYDIHGNVWEWCLDWYGGSYPDTVSNPKGVESGLFRMGRGGSWYNDANACRSANRVSGYPDNAVYFVGFRTVLPTGQ